MASDNKRGQEGVTLTTILLMILGIVVVVLVILFATGFFDKVSEGTDKLPSSLQVAVSACELAARSELNTDYCLAFREVEMPSGVTEYHTCNDLKQYTSDLAELNCEVSATEQDAAAYCAQNKLKKDVKVGSTLCSGTYS
jgi:hypothetical protein